MNGLDIFLEDLSTRALYSLLTSYNLSHGTSIFHTYWEPIIESYMYRLGISIHKFAPESHHPCAQQSLLLLGHQLLQVL